LATRYLLKNAGRYHEENVGSCVRYLSEQRRFSVFSAEQK